MDLRVDYLLHTNHALSEGERAQITNMVSEGETAIKYLDDEIEHLTNMRFARIGQVQKYRASLSYARILPPELISKIFMLCPDRGRIRHTLCQVCSTWRNIAISTRGLWTSVTISLRGSKFDRQMSLLHAICERSGTLPLSIELTTSQNPSENQNPITTLAPYLPRIQHLSLAISQRCFQSLRTLSTGWLPLLESCSLYVARPQNFASSVEVPRNDPIMLFASAHRLRCVELSGSNHDLRLLRLPSQLSKLALDCDFPPDQCLDVLHQCPNLETFSQLRLRESSLVVPHPGVLVLSRLHTVRVRCRESSLRIFFDYLALPSLVDLDLTFYPLEQWPHLSFHSLLSRSSCNLQVLSIQFAIMSRLELLECLRATPSLVRLCIGGMDCLDNWVLGELRFVDGGSRNLVPNLRYFMAQAQQAIGDDITNESFIDMIESRWWPDSGVVGLDTPSRQVARLSTAHLSYDDTRPLHVDDQVLQRIKRCREGGLTVYLGTMTD